MSSKTKNSKTTVTKADEFNEKDFQAEFETLVERLMSYTFRGISRDAPTPEDSDTAERLYQQVRPGFSLASQLDDFFGTKIDEIARFMQKLTENRYKQPFTVESEPTVDENVVPDGSDDDDYGSWYDDDYGSWT